MNLHCLEIRPGLWRLRVRAGAGPCRYRRLAGDRAAAEAAGQAWLAELRAVGISGTASPATPLNRWMAELDRLASTHHEAATRERYAELARLYITPRIGRRQLQSISPAEGQAWMADLLAEGVGVPTVALAFRRVRAALETAKRREVIAANPFALLDAPRPPKGRRAFSRQVIAPARMPVLIHAEGPTALMDQAAELARLALASGARRGELLALTWAEVDLAAGTLRILASLEAPRGDDTPRLKPPKTEEARRTILLPPEAVAELATRRRRAAEVALAAGRPLDTLPVFPDADGIAWWHPRHASRAVRRLLAHHGLPGSLHGLRHAHASALLSGQVNPVAVQRRLGHARLATTLAVYGHALPGDDAAAAAAIGAAMAGERAA